MFATSVAALMMLVPSAASNAQSVVWWTDGTVGGNGSITGALAARPWLTAYAAPSQSDFNNALLSGSYQLAIFGEQNSWVFGSSSSEFTTFLAGGGKVLAASWTRNYSGFASYFGTTITSANESSISGSGAMFASGLTSPFTLTNPGWGIFSEGYSGSESCLAAFGDGSCAAQVALTGNALLLGGLFDTYSVPRDGELYVGNGIDYLLTETVTPEPASMVLLATGLLAIGVAGKRRRTRA
ncbi:MAG: PEP-CTERM sorting domain-containing protein [bacterium]